MIIRQETFKKPKHSQLYFSYNSKKAQKHRAIIDVVDTIHVRGANQLES
jgi:hypothetical protein